MNETKILTGTELLEKIKDNPGLTQRQLCQASRMTQISLIPLVSELEREGYIRRESGRILPTGKEPTEVAEPAAVEKKASKVKDASKTKEEAKPVDEPPIARAPPSSGKSRVGYITNRDYDWTDFMVDGIPDYISQKDELEQLVKFHGQGINVIVTGHRGCGKTLLAQSLAKRVNAPLFTLRGHFGVDPVDLLGRPAFVPDTGTFWVDGIITKALICSLERKCVMLIDEINRMRVEVQSVFMSLLDDRCEVGLDANGGETIRGNPDNLIFIATVNEGAEYKGTEALDEALNSRFSVALELDYLGMEFPDKEAEIIVSRTGINISLAKLMVEAANHLRKMSNDTESEIELGVPTRSLISWGKTTMALAEISDKPFRQGAILSLVQGLYRGISNPIVTVLDPIDQIIDDDAFEELAKAAIK